MMPFRIWGNLYFAGDDSVGIHLIDTGDGLVMLDTGYPQMQGFTVQSIWALGFRPELTMADKTSLFEPDRTLEDGDEIQMGNARIRVQSAAGHTAGTLAVFITLTDAQGAHKIAGMHGGVGLNTLTLDYTRAHRLPKAREQFAENLDRLEGEPVDILLGNHTRQNDTPGKYLRLIARPDAANPFADDGAWRRFIKNTRASFLEMLARERAK